MDDPDTPCAYTVFVPDDVTSCAEDMDIELTNDQISEVLRRTNRYGEPVTWELMEVFIEQVKNEGKNEKKRRKKNKPNK